MLGVREQPAAQASADAAFEEWTRAEEAWDAIKWALARDPTVGEPLTEGGHLRALTFEGATAYDMPTIVVLYDFDTEFVTIHSASFSAARTGQPGRA